MCFDDTLEKILVEMDRRQLLKKAGGVALSASTGGLDKLAGMAGKPLGRLAATPGVSTQDALTTLWSIVYGKGRADNGVANQIIATPSQIAGLVKDWFTVGLPGYPNHKPESLKAWAVGSIGSQDFDVDALDKYTNGAYSRELKNMIAKDGPIKVAQRAGQECFRYGAQRVFRTMYKLSSKFPEMAKVFPTQVFKDALNGDPRKAIDLIKQYQLTTKHGVKQLVDDYYTQQELDRKRDRDDMNRWESEGGRVASEARLNESLDWLLRCLSEAPIARDKR